MQQISAGRDILPHQDLRLSITKIHVRGRRFHRLEVVQLLALNEPSRNSGTPVHHPDQFYNTRQISGLNSCPFRHPLFRSWHLWSQTPASPLAIAHTGSALPHTALGIIRAAPGWAKI